MSPLEEIIREEIASDGPMRFDRFMELALYHEAFGYYATKDRQPASIGREGDFFTSVSVGPLFGRLLARQFFQMWEKMQKPSPFWILEQGAHNGRLACDVLKWIERETPDFFKAVRYGLVNAPGALELLERECGSARVTHFADFVELAEINPEGVFFSNELADAFPVRRIIFKSGRWMEQCVDAKETLAWTEQEIDDARLLEELAARSIPEVEGYTTEINLCAFDWMEEVGLVMKRGYVLTIDYGYPASVYYADFRSGGTLTAYEKHQRSGDVLSSPGTRDITAHVDFTALIRAGKMVGLTPLALVDQQRFLTGIAHDELSGVGKLKAGIQENMREWMTLTHPNHLGAKFHALVQAKNAPVELDGLRFARQGGWE